MLANKNIIVLFSTIIIAFSSEIALAVDKANSGSLFAGWPLIVLFILLIVFRKKLFAEATAHPEEIEHQEPAKEEISAPEPEPTKIETKKTEPVVKTKTEIKTDSIDLNDDANQCQARTTKGTRCKRKTTLEKTSREIDGKTYHLTVCSQHNNDALKVFSGLLK